MAKIAIQQAPIPPSNDVRRLIRELEEQWLSAPSDDLIYRIMFERERLTMLAKLEYLKPAQFVNGNDRGGGGNNPAAWETYRGANPVQFAPVVGAQLPIAPPTEVDNWNAETEKAKQQNAGFTINGPRVP